MDNKNTFDYDKEVRDIFSGMENYVKKPLDIEASIMQKIESEKDYSVELKVLRKKVRIGQLLLLVLGFCLVPMFFWPVISKNSLLISEASDFDILPTLYALLVLFFGFYYVRIKTQFN